MYNLLDKYEYVVDVVALERPLAITEPVTPTRDVPVAVRARTARFSVPRADVLVLDETLRDTPFVERVCETFLAATLRDATPRETTVLSSERCDGAFVVRDTVERDTVRLEVVVFERGL